MQEVAFDARLRRDPPRVPSFFSEAVREQYSRSRFTAIGTRALRGALKESATGEEVPINRDSRDRISELIQQLHDMEPNRENHVLPHDEALFRFDVYFRQRRLQHVSGKISEKLGAATDPDEARRLRSFARNLCTHSQAAEIICYWMEYVMDRAQLAWDDPGKKTAQQVWSDIRWSLEQLLDVSPSNPTATSLSYPHLKAAYDSEKNEDRIERERANQAALAGLYESLKRRAQTICMYEPEHERILKTGDDFQGLLDAADKAAHALFKQPYYAGQTDLLAELAGYVGLDAMVYPLELVSDLASKERIRILRISPRDAKTAFCARPIEDKIAGKALAHFGGFFKRSWRSNDILWGRLDALCELVENVLTTKRLEGHPERTRAVREGSRALRPSATW